MTDNRSADSISAYNVASGILGHCGRMISGSKSLYNRQHPKNVVVFNANVCTRSRGKIWYGDLDVTRDERKLMELAAALDEDVYVLHEHDARFENEAKPRLDKARAVASAGSIQIRERQY